LTGGVLAPTTGAVAPAGTVIAALWRMQVAVKREAMGPMSSSLSARTAGGLGNGPGGGGNASVRAPIMGLMDRRAIAPVTNAVDV